MRSTGHACNCPDTEPMSTQFIGRIVVLILVCLGFFVFAAHADTPKRRGTLALPLNAIPKMWPVGGTFPTSSSTSSSTCILPHQGEEM
jgi:hypothetical protein